MLRDNGAVAFHGAEISRRICYGSLNQFACKKIVSYLLTYFDDVVIISRSNRSIKLEFLYTAIARITMRQ